MKNGKYTEYSRILHTFAWVKISRRISLPHYAVLPYTSQCPFTAKYVPLLEAAAQESGVAFQAVHITTREQAQSIPCPFTTFALYYDGRFVTHEIQSVSKFQKLLMDLKK